MAELQAVLPKSQVVAAALRKTTEGLANSLGRSFSQAHDSLPEWSDFEWRIAKAAAAIHGVAPLLSDTLRWQGPAEWVRFLADQKAHTLSRHRHMEELLTHIDKRAREEGIATVALKGAALHALGLYVPGERPMADVDLLVAERDSPVACRMIEALGFHQTLVTWKHRVFEAADGRPPGLLGEHAGNHLKIELHTRIGEALPMRITQVTQRIYPTQPHPGLNAYPSRAALMIHLLLHASGAMVFRAIRLLHLCDLARLSSRMTATDWDEVLRYGIPDPQGWTLLPLKLTARYFTSTIPPHVLETLKPACPWLLTQVTRRRSLSDFSLSHPWVEAFPGIEWSRSTAELLQYIVSRVRPPGAQLLAARRKMLQSHASTQSEWQHLSQGRRVLRWVMSRPARDETMFAVRAALSSGAVRQVQFREHS